MTHRHRNLRSERQEVLLLGPMVRAFTLIEAVVVFALIGLMAGVAYATFGQSDNPADTTTARASLVQLENLQATRADGPVTDTATLGSLDPSRTWTTDVSDAADIVSVAVDPNNARAYGAAVAFGDGGCWLLRRDLAATSAGESQIWAVAASGTCSASRALALSADPTGVRGGSVGAPLEL